jgi:hypothetical protein
MNHINQFDWHEITTQEELGQGKRTLIRGLEKGSRVPSLEERTGKKDVKRNMGETLAIEQFDTKAPLTVGLEGEQVTFGAETWSVHEDGIRGYILDGTVHAFYPWARVRGVTQPVK